jgi:hypothetical protein
MTRLSRRFRLEPALQEILSVLIEAKMKVHVEAWTQQVKDGEISEEARRAFVALGWMSERDGRALPVEPAKPKAGPA